MPGDIRMRLCLSKDTRVIAITNHLELESKEFSEWFDQVNPHKIYSDVDCPYAGSYLPNGLLMHVSLSALMSVWGAAAEIGKSNGDDAVLPYSTISMLDQISGVPGFGRAMELVGWAVQEPDGVRLPRFLRYNEIASERGSESEPHSTNADRQRRFRDKRRTSTDDRNAAVTRSNVTRNVTAVTRPDPALPASPAQPEIKTPAKPVAGSGKPVAGACAIVEAGNRKEGRGAFKGLTTDDLRDPINLMNWYDMAKSRQPVPVVGSSEADLLRVFGAAERALDEGRNPPALFASLVSRQQWNMITQSQEDRARRKLKELRE